jgi:hypothetical protein
MPELFTMDTREALFRDLFSQLNRKVISVANIYATTIQDLSLIKADVVLDDGEYYAVISVVKDSFLLDYTKKNNAVN